MKVIGLTGGIGAGKSVVSRILRCKGYSVYDCDLEAKRLMDRSGELKRDIVLRFGEECVDGGGCLVRSAIARHVFSDPAKRLWLNSVVHEMVRQDICRKLDRQVAPGDADIRKRRFFIESAILNTGGITPMCDEVWLVEASEETRIKRVCSRDAATPEQVRARIEVQKSEVGIFGDLPCRVICNDDESPILEEVERMLSALK